MISSSKDVIAILMKRGATQVQAEGILADMFKTRVGPFKDWRDRTYHAVKWALAKADEYGKKNASSSLSHH